LPKEPSVPAVFAPPSRPCPLPARAPSLHAALPRPRAVRIGLLGLGTVGQGLVALLGSRREDLARRHGLAFEVEGVLVRDVAKPRRVRPEGVPVTADGASFLLGAYDVVVEAIGGVE